MARGCAVFHATHYQSGKNAVLHAAVWPGVGQGYHGNCILSCPHPFFQSVMFFSIISPIFPRAQSFHSPHPFLKPFHVLFNVCFPSLSFSHLQARALHPRMPLFGLLPWPALQLHFIGCSQGLPYNVSRNTYKPTYKPNPKPSYKQLYLDITSYNFS